MNSLSSHTTRVNTSAREFLRQQASEHRGANDLPPSLDRLISQSTDAVNAILVAARCQASLRAYIDAVLGIVHAKIKAGQPLGDFFEASDLEIARRALADRADDISVLALKKWTQRQRAALIKWQKQSGYTLIECEPGGMDDDRNNHPTRYRVPLLACAAEVLTEAQSDPAFQRDPHLALQSAAEIALAGLPSTPAKRERFRRPRRDGSALLQRNTKTIESLFRRNLEILTKKAGLDPDKVILSAREHFEEVVAAARRALDEVIEQAERARGGGSPPPAQQSNSGEGNGARSQGSTHSPASHPMDKSVTTPTGQPGARDARRRARPAPEQEASISLPAPEPVHTPMDKSVSTPMDKSVHTLNNENNGQGTQGGVADPALITDLDPASEAASDLALFESVGAQSFDLTILGEVQRNSSRKFIDYEKELPADRLREVLPELVERCERERLNLIIRPRIVGGDRRFVQLDDLGSRQIERVSEFTFRIVETSPGNYQAWVCVTRADEDLERRLKRGVAADVGANGATRVAGTLNVKEQYRAASYPRIRLIAGVPGRVCRIEDLAGLLEPDPDPPCVPLPASERTGEPLPMPDYHEFVSRAHRTATGEIDRSAVDYAWAATSLKRGHSAEMVMTELERVSLKATTLAKAARKKYVMRTVMAAGRESL